MIGLYDERWFLLFPNYPYATPLSSPNHHLTALMCHLNSFYIFFSSTSLFDHHLPAPLPSPSSRCNLATILLSDLVFEGVEGIDWTQHIPLLLHIAFLGLDHTRALIHEHCKQMILHLLVLCCVQVALTVLVLLFLSLLSSSLAI